MRNPDSKQKEFKIAVDKKKFNIIGITENWWDHSHV